MPLFDFTLRPLELVAPFGLPDDSTDRHLSWFGLTDGVYSIDVGIARLFQYTPEFIHEHLKEWPGSMPFSGCADYYVVRLYEDILDMVPTIWAEIPEELHLLVCGVDTHRSWQKSLKWAYDIDDDPELDDLYFTATDWIGYRRLDSGYLRDGPRIWMWHHAGRVWIQWDNEDRVKNGIPRWTAKAGQISMPLGSFMLEVESLHNRLMAAMADRIILIERDNPLPGVAIDIPGLKREHGERQQSLVQALNVEIPSMNWADIIEANTCLQKRRTN